MSHLIRPAEAADLPACLALDDSYTTGWVWQVVVAGGSGPIAWQTEAGDDDEQRTVTFRPARLPRPRQVVGLAALTPHSIRAHWQYTDYFSVATESAEVGGEIYGYVNLHLERRRNIAWLLLLTVAEGRRRQGLGRTLLDDAKQWARLAGAQSIIAELPTVNYPATHFLQMQGFSFCGYNDALDPARIETTLMFVYPLA